MSRWNLFKKLKSKKEEKPDIEKSKMKETQDTEETETKGEETNLAEYHETLHTEDSSKKKKVSSDRHVWRDVKSIEENVDGIRKSKGKKPKSDLEKTVDRILSKKKK